MLLDHFVWLGFKRTQVYDSKSTPLIHQQQLASSPPPLEALQLAEQSALLSPTPPHCHQPNHARADVLVVDEVEE
jgi:hypothetical protein